uniref:Gustatory receptor n=1 Tax=Meteorus pulchricornis TaxID=51522 RepID=A0A346TLL5_9HYME|nr:gustatory receptor [Meteorus pulchricornis]
MLLATIYFGSLVIDSSYTLAVSFITDPYWDKTYVRITNVSWLVTELYNFFLLCSSVTRTVRESKRVSSSIHLILDRCTTDTKIETELMEFSRELLQRRVEFNVYGMFSLDLSLLYSVLSATVTYLIILIQFQLQ